MPGMAPERALAGAMELRQNACMATMVMDDRPADAQMLREALDLPRFDRLVMQLRWADGLNRAEAALVLKTPPASVLAAELRLLAWIAARSFSRT
jgi:DNA-directed RNA polymerase specialized sigma subunit